ncbi:MAG TPA: phosphoribosyltransferase family protein [Prolixibacteraceae bacterium]|nr:phosphoribosyltransferase family protein [Prolixibacteraceae bacterium]
MKKIISSLKEHLEDFSTLIYPNLCLCCNEALVKQEKHFCTPCAIGLPRTYYHLASINPVEQLFWGRVKIERATSYFLYQKGSKYQKLLHQLKYRGNQNVGVELGRMFAVDLNEVNYFAGVDYIVPVPLHPRKKRKRGFNQSEAVASGMQHVLQKEIIALNLKRRHYTSTQTRKGRFERWENVQDLFIQKDPEIFEGKHILMVDDVVTTGSTLEACAHAVLKSYGAKVSVATLAYAVI